MMDKEISSADIYLGIPRDKVIVRSLTFPLAIKENLYDTLTYEMEKYVPIPIDDIYFDSQITFEDRSNNRISVLLVAIKKTDFEPIIGFVNRLGFGVSGVEISSTALLNYFSMDSFFKDETDYAIIFSDSDRVEICLIRNGYLNATKMISMSSFDVNSPEQMVLEEIKNLQQDSDTERPVSEAVVCGNVKNILQEGHKTNNIKFIFSDPGSSSSLEITDDSLIPAFGLALKGLKKVPMSLNLLPGEFRKAPKKTGYYVAYMLLGLVLLLFMTWTGSSLMYQRQIREMQESEIKRLSSEVTRISRIKEKSDELANRMNTIHQMTTNRVALLDILNEITTVLPRSSWIHNFDFSDDSVQIEGVSPSASALIPLLESSALFQEVLFLSTISKDKDGKEKFRVGFKVKR